MNPEQREFWSKILAFDIDGGPAELTFAKRLARENGWAVSYAEGVVEEYRRFVFLCFAAGHKCTPSDQVDQAWHLHMVYTESYWTRMCGQVLGQPLHHGPTKGGKAEGDKFVDWYERTKESYARLFGHEPPSDIWPSADARFARAGAWRRVDTSRYWMIDKARFRAGTASALAMVALGIGAAGCSLLQDESGATGKVLLILGIAVAAIGLISYASVNGFFDRQGKGGGGCGGGGSCAGGGDSSGCGGGGCGGGGSCAGGGDSSGCGGGGCGGGGCGGGGCGGGCGS